MSPRPFDPLDEGVIPMSEQTDDFSDAFDDAPSSDAVASPSKSQFNELGPPPDVATVTEPNVDVTGSVIRQALSDAEQASADAPSSGDTPQPGDKPDADQIADQIAAAKGPLDRLPDEVEATAGSIDKAYAALQASKGEVLKQLREIDRGLNVLTDARRSIDRDTVSLHELNLKARKIQASEDEQRQQERELLAKYLGVRRHRGARGSTSRPMPPTPTQ